MGRVFRALGLSVGRVLDNNLGPDKTAAFSADVTYVTASDLAWLYLSDNTSVMRMEDLVSSQHDRPLIACRSFASSLQHISHRGTSSKISQVLS